MRIAPKPPAAPSAPPIAPAAVPADSKKETAKVPPPPSKSALPQATVQLAKKEPPASPKPPASSTAPAVATQPTAASTEELNPMLGAAALVLSLVAFAIQLWILLTP